jgi:CTP synthase
MLQDEGMDRIVIDKLNLKTGPEDMSEWREMVQKILNPSHTVTIGLVGKYVALPDAYMSVTESLRHAGIANDAAVQIKWVNAEHVEACNGDLDKMLSDVDGILVPGGFGDRGIEGKIRAIQYARENKVPFFGLCLGMQCAVIEYARNVCGLTGAHSSEFEPETPYPVIDLMPEQVAVVEKGGTMRLGIYPCKVMPNTLTFKAYEDEIIYERHRHRFEFNNAYREQLATAGLVIGGTLPNDRLVEIVEVKDHPWFVGTQFHPEFKSRPTKPHPLFRDFIAAALNAQQKK